MYNGDGLFDRDPNNRNKYIFPDTLNFQKEPFATVIPSRSVTFKVHKTEGLANSALSHHGQGAKYKQENGVWVKVWEFTEPTNCSNCNSVLDADRDKVKTYYGYRGSWLQSPLWKGSRILTPTLCRPCYEQEAKVASEKREVLDQRAWERYKRKQEEKARQDQINNDPFRKRT